MQVGLKVLLNDANVFKCFSSLDEAIWHAEAGSSLAILNANYNLDCLMLRYQGIDWRQPDYRECNAGSGSHPSKSLAFQSNFRPVLASF